MIRNTDRKMPIAKRVGVYLLLALFIIGIGVGTSTVMDLMSPNPAPIYPDAVQDIRVQKFLMLVGGSLFLGLGVLVYGMAMVTRCCTFNFHKILWNRLKVRIYLTHTVVVFSFAFSAACFVCLIASPVLAARGVLPWSMAVAGPGLGALIPVQLLFTMWLNIWAPLETAVIKQRMTALGIPSHDIDTGLYIGLSNPAKNSFKKFTLIEEDIGMMWIGSDELYYRGDSDSFRIRRNQLIEIERKVDLGSVSAYGGNVNTILTFQTPEGAERKVRLHCEGCWNMAAVSKASDSLANKIAAWKTEQA